MFDIAGVMEEYIDNTYASEGIGKAVGGAIRGIFGGLLKVITSIINRIGDIIKIIANIPLAVISKFKNNEKIMQSIEKRKYKKGEAIIGNLVTDLRTGAAKMLKITNNLLKNENTANESISNFTGLEEYEKEYEKFKQEKIKKPLKKFEDEELKISPEFAKSLLSRIKMTENAYTDIKINVEKWCDVYVRRMNPDTAGNQHHMVFSSLVEEFQFENTVFSKLYMIVNSTIMGGPVEDIRPAGTDGSYTNYYNMDV